MNFFFFQSLEFVLYEPALRIISLMLKILQIKF